MDEKKTEGLIGDHLVWNEEEKKVDEEEARLDDKEVEEGALEKIVTKVEIALSGTQNSSAPRLDSISYGLIKTIKNTILGEKMLEEVAKNLIKGIILKEWQNSKVIMIPKTRALAKR